MAKIYCENGFCELNKDERIQLATLLVKAGYTVRLDRERLGTSSKYAYVIIAEK